MTREPVTIVIPVGPEPSHRRWLGQAVRSVAEQASGRDRIMLIADGGAPLMSSLWLDHADELGDNKLWRRMQMTSVTTMPWPTGVAGAFNAGVGYAEMFRDSKAANSDLVIMLGSDDLLIPGAIDACVQTWEEADRADAYYWMSIEYSDDRKDKIQALPCNAAMVTRAFWRWCGGFPPETASGAPDAALVSMLMVHAPEKLIAVQQGTPLQWVRVHEGQDTAGRAPWQGVIHATRDILTKRGFQS